jgi:hypothetical protein
MYGKSYREYQNTYGQPYQSPCKKNKVTGVTLQYLRRLELLLRKLGQRDHLLNKIGRLMQKSVGSFLRLLPSNLIINRRLKMNSVGDSILDKHGTASTHAPQIVKAAISQLSVSPECKGVVDVHSAKMPNPKNS